MSDVQTPQILVQSGAFEALIPAFDYPQGAAMPWVVVDQGSLVPTQPGGGFAVFPIADRPKKKRKKQKIQVEQEAKLPKAQTDKATDTVLQLEPVGEWLELERSLREVTENLAKLALEEQEQLRLALEIADEVLAKSIAEAIINEQFQKINELLQQEEDAIKANAIKEYLAVVLQAQKKARKERNRKRIIQLMMIGEI